MLRRIRNISWYNNLYSNYIYKAVHGCEPPFPLETHIYGNRSGMCKISVYRGEPPKTLLATFWPLKNQLMGPTDTPVYPKKDSDLLIRDEIRMFMEFYVRKHYEEYFESKNSRS